MKVRLTVQVEVFPLLIVQTSEEQFLHWSGISRESIHWGKRKKLSLV